MTIIITYLKHFTIHPYKKPTSSQFQFQFKTTSTLLTSKKHVKDRLTRRGTDESGTLALASKVSNEKSEREC